MRNIGRFIDMRNSAKRGATRGAPIFVHGYDYLQPRPAGAVAVPRDGGNDAQLRSTADAVIDEMNRQLRSVIAALPNVRVIDQRGPLTPAAPGTSGPDADWLDEIHPNEAGFAKLARNRWDVPPSRALGWVPGVGDLVAPLAVSNPSTRQRRLPTNRWTSLDFAAMKRFGSGLLLSAFSGKAGLQGRPSERWSRFSRRQ